MISLFALRSGHDYRVANFQITERNCRQTLKHVGHRHLSPLSLSSTRSSPRRGLCARSASRFHIAARSRAAASCPLAARGWASAKHHRTALRKTADNRLWLQHNGDWLLCLQIINFYFVRGSIDRSNGAADDFERAGEDLFRGQTHTVRSPFYARV